MLNIQNLMSQYVISLPNDDKEDWYTTSSNAASSVLSKFCKWCSENYPDIETEKLVWGRK